MSTDIEKTLKTGVAAIAAGFAPFFGGIAKGFTYTFGALTFLSFLFVGSLSITALTSLLSIDEVTWATQTVPHIILSTLVHLGHRSAKLGTNGRVFRCT